MFENNIIEKGGCGRPISKINKIMLVTLSPSLMVMEGD